MTEVHLDATDAMELAEILLFVRNWLARDSHAPAPSLAALRRRRRLRPPSRAAREPHPIRLPPRRGPRGILPQRRIPIADGGVFKGVQTRETHARTAQGEGTSYLPAQQPAAILSHARVEHFR